MCIFIQVKQKLHWDQNLIKIQLQQNFPSEVSIPEEEIGWWTFVTLPSIVEIFEIEYFNRFGSSKLEQWWKYFQDQNIKTNEKRLIEEWLQYHRHINTWLNYWVVMENQSKLNYNSYARVYSHGKIYWRSLKQFTNSIIVLQSL